MNRKRYYAAPRAVKPRASALETVAYILLIIMMGVVL
jgi:hypothetical protein